MVNYLAEGIQNAAQARDMIDNNWADSWKNYAAQYALAKDANDHEIAMWNMQNEYNTPSAQMQRLKDAGLNPMLAYNMANSGNASSSPQTHVPNAQISPDADRRQEGMYKLNMAMGIINGITETASKMLGVTDQGMDLQIKRNDLDWSNFDAAVANNMLLGYGTGRYNKNYTYGFLGNVARDLDPSNPDFDPAGFRVLQRLGISNYMPRQITADASAKLAGERAQYQDYYNREVLPKVKEFMEGKVNLQQLQKSMLEYQDKALEALPPQIRGILKPILDILKPFLR